MKSAESLTLKMINGKLSHLEWQGKWSYAHLCRFTDGRLIMCLKKAQSVFLNGTDCRYTPDTLFKHLAKFVTYLVSTHVINPTQNVTNIQQMYTGIEIN